MSPCEMSWCYLAEDKNTNCCRSNPNDWISGAHNNTTNRMFAGGERYIPNTVPWVRGAGGSREGGGKGSRAIVSHDFVKVSSHRKGLLASDLR